MSAAEVNIRFPASKIGVQSIGNEVVRVDAGSASELRGVKVGWRILKVDGVPMPVDDNFYIKEQIIQRINAGTDFDILFAKAEPSGVHLNMISSSPIGSSPEAALAQSATHANAHHPTAHTPPAAAAAQPALPKSAAAAAPAGTQQAAAARWEAGILPVVLFVNPGAGGNLAGSLTRMGIPFVRFDKPAAEVHIFALLDDSPKKDRARQAGVELVRSLSTAGVNVKVIACGGDGTVMWVASILIGGGCNMSNVQIGVMPFGTGNDLARVLGFGGNAPSPLIGNGLTAFKGLVAMYAACETKTFDVWKVVLTFRPNGKCYTVKKEGSKWSYDTKEGEAANIDKKMNNYCSVGVDAQIGFEFDKRRTASQAGNKLVYATRGMASSILPPPTVQRMLDKVVELLPDGTERIVFTNKSDQSQPSLRRAPQSICLMNIPSIAGGSDVWAWSKKPGLKKEKQHCFYLDGKVEAVPKGGSMPTQDFGDGLLELLAFADSSSIGMERSPLTRGNAGKIGQVKGARFYFSADNGSAQPIQTHLNIDGEFYMIESPLMLEVTHCETTNMMTVNRKV